MNLAPIPPALPLWLLLTLPLLVTLLLVFWVTQRDTKTAAYRKATGDMLLEAEAILWAEAGPRAL